MLSANMCPIAMSTGEKNTKVGVVVENLPNTMFRVQFEDDERTSLTPEEIKELPIVTLAGKMKLYRIRILVGDTVEVLLDPYGGKGRIIKRL